MTNSFLIGEVLTNLLINDEEIKELVDNKIYPIIASEGTDFPFIIYKRLSDISNGCKDGYYEDTVTFNITIVSSTYAESISIALLVRKKLEKQKIVADNMTLYETHITSATEDYIDNVYTLKLNFITKIN